MLGGFYWGFPKLGGCGGLAFYRKEELETEMNREKTEPNHQWEFMKCPTFEELVKECMRFGLEFGEGMPSFTMRLEGGKIEKSAGWRAVETYAEGESHLFGEGDTPQEAVANLWLVLKAKSEGKLNGKVDSF